MLPKYAPGEKIPGTPYVVAHRIGRGGMGDVLAVRDEHLDIIRAIKLLDLEPRPGQKRADAVTEVLKEAVVIAKLHKLCREHIVEVLFVGQTADANQIPFIVMELIDGAPLRDLLKRRGGKLEPAHARQVGVDVLAALAAAHDQGIVHRDLKPANIMCEMLDQNRVRMKVIDFGIVGGINQRTKRIAGTFRYAAPEQIHISGPSPLMAQTDLYALGCILYECLAGQGPFDSYCKTNEHFVHAHLTAQAPPISTYVPGIPRAFDAFFASILAKDVAHRPASARACAAQLMDLPWEFSGDQDVTKTEEMLEAAIQSVVANHQAGRAGGASPAPNAHATSRSPGHPAAPQGDVPPQQARNMNSQAAPTPRMPGAPGAPGVLGAGGTLMSPRGATVRVDHMAMTLPLEGAPGNPHMNPMGPHDGPTRTSSPLVRQAPKNETDPLPEDVPNASVPAPSAWGMGGVYPPPSNRDGDARDASTFGAVMRSFQLSQISPSALRFAIAAAVLCAAALCVALGVVLAHHHHEASSPAELAAAAS
ncbi:MAG: protein kinase, partial [Polyangiaceae bacterium]